MNLIVPFIFVKPLTLTRVWGPPGGRGGGGGGGGGGAKMSKVAHPFKNDTQKLEICTEV